MLLLILKIVFWTSVFALVHTYVIYPFIVNLLAKNKILNQNVYDINEDLPVISIIMAVRNAENVIHKKIQSIYKSEYPINKIEFLIGSDASDDKTNDIIFECIKQFPKLRFTKYTKRVGKVTIINDLSLKAKGEIFLFTDVHAIPEENTIFHLIKHFKNQDIALVCGNLKNIITGNIDVSVQEEIYLKSEIQLKYNEGVLWGNLMGAYGAFFAILKKEFKRVPTNFLVDDFFISFNAVLNGKKAILEPKAVVNEKITGNVQQEFKRKMRISSGNFQNLKFFSPILFSKKRLLAFRFFSHKVLRWFGPIFILLMVISTAFLFVDSVFYKFVATLVFFSLISPIIDYFLRKCGIHIILLRFISHYYYMNLGLFIGLLKYIKGVKSNVWEPTNRESKL